MTVFRLKTIKTYKVFSIALFLIGIIFHSFVHAQALQVSSLEAQIKKGMQDWSIPGLAIAIVKDNQVIYSKGFGEKRIGTGEKVDEHTIFGIASVSKNITAAALALLVDEGKLTWDDRIVEIIPWFQMQDPYVTKEIRVRDLLTHQVGLGRILGNRLQFMTEKSRDELLYQVRFMELEKPFRSSFVYSNMMYSLAGQLIEYVEGVTWDDFLKTRFFDKMGMKNANTSIRFFKDGDNVAWPHQEIEGEVKAIQRRNWDNAGPAGGINASVYEMAKWLKLQLGNPGVYEGQRIISQQQMTEMHKPQSIRSQRDAYGPITAYGLGWNITDYENHRVLSHGGATDGFNTAAYMVPDLNLGIIVVGNTFNTLGDALAYSIMDDFIGIQGKNWPKTYRDNYLALYEVASKQREAIHQARHAHTKPTFELSSYIGLYEDLGYGQLEVKQGAKGLELHFWGDENLIADLEHWHFDTFRAVWRNPAQREEFVVFSVDNNGNPTVLEYEFSLRPMLLQVGAYPSNYTKTVRFKKKD